MQTSFTSGQLVKLIQYLDSMGVDPAQFQNVLKSGVLKHLFNSRADFSNPLAIIRALKLDPDECGLLFFDLAYPPDLPGLFLKARMGNVEPTEITTHAIPSARIPAEVALTGGTVTYAAKLFEFNSGVSRPTVKLKMARSGWTPAGHEHMLGFLAKYANGASAPSAYMGMHLVGLGTPVTVASQYAARVCPGSGWWEYGFLDPKYVEKGSYSGGSLVRYLGVRVLR